MGDHVIAMLKELCDGLATVARHDISVTNKKLAGRLSELGERRVALWERQGHVSDRIPAMGEIAPYC